MSVMAEIIMKASRRITGEERNAHRVTLGVGVVAVGVISCPDSSSSEGSFSGDL
jgi:hypothetical protein